ncbi:aminotransferase class IV [Neolewinella antarctica]|uniref:4-amino-4-deoxychorismate lyase n=1 Tax=Neolewinella antarctica TaxID=442734 RepID=A0ABX0X6D5_9BACT|nr:aminotransferase class IV [Neolewinella antarctica]NJC24559.1 4-amino-4-deoxychorismate lyase [Neolewinella antarctica]
MKKAPALIESIRLIDGEIPLLSLHQSRMDRARRAIYAKSPVIRLSKLIAETELPRSGLHKLRVEYDTTIIKAEIIPYEIKPINSLKLTRAEELTYGHKFAERAGIGKLFERRGKADDIIMAKNGYLMDSSYANLAFYDGRHWYTPAYPMLKGVRRELLLKNNVIRPAIIRDRDLASFKKVRLMNAMLEWEEGPEIAIDHVYL